MDILNKRAHLVRYLWIISALVATAAVIIYYLVLPFVYEFDGFLYLNFLQLPLRIR